MYIYDKDIYTIYLFIYLSIYEGSVGSNTPSVVGESLESVSLGIEPKKKVCCHISYTDYF